MAPTNAQPVGKAILVYGTVKAIAANGTERVLGPNSLIYANERIVTGPDGSVSIAFAGHPEHLVLGRMSDVAIDEDVYAPPSPGQDESPLVSAEDIQAALQDGGFDPTTGLPAPSAGGGNATGGAVDGGGARGGGRQLVNFDTDLGGSRFLVIIDADQMEVIPASGLDTHGNGLDFLDYQEDLGDVETMSSLRNMRTPLGDTATPPDDAATPPDDAATPPDDAATPPDDAATPPDDTATPPDDTETQTDDSPSAPGTITAVATNVQVSEEGLGGASPDNFGDTDTTNIACIVGKLAFTSTSGHPLTFTFTDVPAGLTSNGVTLIWTGAGTGTLVGKAGGTEVLILTLNGQGDYSIALGGPLDHDNTSKEDTQDLSFGVLVTDGSISTTTTLTVTIEDDSPLLNSFGPAMLAHQFGTVSGQFDIASGGDGIKGFNIETNDLDNNKISYDTASSSDGTTTLTGYLKGGDVLNPNDQVFTLTVRPDGTYTYELLHPNAGVTGGGGSTIQLKDISPISPDKQYLAEIDNGLIELSTRTSAVINSDGTGFGVGPDLLVGKNEYFTLEFHDTANLNVNDLPSSNKQLIDSVTLKIDSPVDLKGNANLTYNWSATKNIGGHVYTESGLVMLSSSSAITINPDMDFNTITITGALSITGGAGVQFTSLDVTYASDRSQALFEENQRLDFYVQAVDKDGDTSDTKGLSVLHVPLNSNEGYGSSYFFQGSELNDWITAGSGKDVIFGEDGRDVVDYSDSTSAVSVDLADSGHTEGAAALVGDAAGDVLDSVEGVVGGKGDDTLIGNSGANYFDGGAGSDTIQGEDGDDRVVYDPSDTLAGGDGDDTLVVKMAATIDLSNALDQSVDAAANNVTGFEHVDASVSPGTVNLTGDSGSNMLIGGSGADTLDGGLGSDTLTGGRGIDTFKASAGNDVVTDYNKGEGDVVDISNLLADADRDHRLSVDADNGHARLTIQNDAGGALGSITFETIDNNGGMDIDGLLNQIDVKDSHGTL